MTACWVVRSRLINFQEIWIFLAFFYLLPDSPRVTHRDSPESSGESKEATRQERDHRIRNTNLPHIYFFCTWIAGLAGNPMGLQVNVHNTCYMHKYNKWYTHDLVFIKTHQLTLLNLNLPYIHTASAPITDMGLHCAHIYSYIKYYLSFTGRSLWHNLYHNNLNLLNYIQSLHFRDTPWPWGHGTHVPELSFVPGTTFANWPIVTCGSARIHPPIRRNM